MLTIENEIKMGDIVQLKSGGPDMTAYAFQEEEVLDTDANPKKTGRHFIYAMYLMVGFYIEKSFIEGL